MSTTDRIIQYLMLLAITYLVLAYWQGTTNVINAGAGALNSIGLTFSGRKADGSPSGYAR